MEIQNNRLLKRNQTRGFTLIELLVVIGIIAIVAALIVNLSGKASTSRKISRVQTELARLETVIDAYQSKLGFYPPDNGDLVKDGESRPSARINQLFYELTGTTFIPDPAPGRFVSLVRNQEISASQVSNVFKRDGIANSQNAKSFFAPKESEHKAIQGDVQVLVVPVELNPGEINPWRYDSSSTNRHNKDSYDLWAEIRIGSEVKIIGNWKE